MKKVFRIGSIFFLLATADAFAETLVRGAVYYDSKETLELVKKLASANNIGLISQLLAEGRVSVPIPNDRRVVVLSSGPGPESPASFYFVYDPNPHWTLTKFLVDSSVTPGPEATPAPIPSFSPTPTPIPVPTPTPTLPKNKDLLPQPSPAKGAEEKIPPFLDTEGGERIWHRNAAGEWKYHLKKYPPRTEPAPPPQQQGSE